MKFISFDLEATGLRSQTDAITEVAFLKFEDGQVVDKLVTLINPNQPISQRITEITGIDDLMVKHQPVFKDVAQKISDFIGNDLLVAYNAPYDKGFLNVAFYQAGIHKHYNPLICSMALIVKIKNLPSKIKLIDALNICQIPIAGNGFHRAEFDAYHNGLMFHQETVSLDPQVLYDLQKQLKIPNEQYEPALYAEYVKRYGIPAPKRN